MNSIEQNSVSDFGFGSREESVDNVNFLQRSNSFDDDNVGISYRTATNNDGFDPLEN